MGVLDRWRGVVDVAADAAQPPALLERGPRQTFAIGTDYATTWPPLLSGTATLPLRIGRAQALSVPSVTRAKNLIAGTIGALPLHAVNSLGETVDHPLLQQPESPMGLVRSVTITRTVADLLFESTSLWLVILRTPAGFPQAIQGIRHGEWTQDETGEIRVRGQVVDSRDVVLFTSANDPLLVAGARAIGSLLQLEQTAALIADEPEPAVQWRAADGVDPDEDDVLAFLTAWRNARKSRATAFVPAAFEKIDAKRQTPEELQLISAREFAVTEIGRLTGLSSDWLNVNVTTRAYSNAQDDRRQFIDFVLAPFILAVEQRLSLNDVTPRGQAVKFSLDAFLRSDTKTRYESYQTALTAGFLTLDEVRALEDREPLEGTQ